ncbi:universal stress protein [Amphritea sp.]|uniref:universal stress protein n=1 Tax=Amphritea sp. TaxID=1872502 RepID=UPI0025B9D16F|nr:universal stress protein [Amphritea sp.]
MPLKTIDSILYASDLLGHDGRNAFRVAVSHAVAHNAKLIFLNVIEPLSPMAERAASHCFNDDEIAEIRDKGYRRVQDDIFSRINRFCDDELTGDMKLPFEPEVCVQTGMTAETILQVSKDKSVDMIVMGTRTHSKLSQVVLGSTAHQVLFHATCPVLIIPLD